MVVLKEVDAHHNDWPLGQIKEPIRSDDGLVRKAHVELWKDGSKKVYLRPIKELILLVAGDQERWVIPWHLKQARTNGPWARRVQNKTIVLFFLLCSRWALIWFIVISVFSWATLCFIYFRSFRVTLSDLSLSRHARRFKFYVASAKACVKIFAYFVKKVFQSILFVTTFCYYFIVFPSGTEFFGVFHLRSHYGRKLHFYFLFVSSTFSLLWISINRNFRSRFIVHFSFYRICCVAQQLGNEEEF